MTYITFQETLRTALAKGADRAIHVEVEEVMAEKIEPLLIAKVNKFLVVREREKAKQII